MGGVGGSDQGVDPVQHLLTLPGLFGAMEQTHLHIQDQQCAFCVHLHLSVIGQPGRRKDKAPSIAGGALVYLLPKVKQPYPPRV
ncbi:hypothetical protein D3C84_1056230 [compost metagenome]